jgi:hypothetical protein
MLSRICQFCIDDSQGLWIRDALSGGSRSKRRVAAEWFRRSGQCYSYRNPSVLPTIGQSAARLDALHRDTGYLKYISALENANYFEGQIWDSQQWKAKEREAAKMWLQIRRDEYVLVLRW